MTKKLKKVVVEEEVIPVYLWLQKIRRSGGTCLPTGRLVDTDWEYENVFDAAVVELVDTLDLKSNEYYNARAGSSPACGTSLVSKKRSGFFMLISSFRIAGREVYPDSSGSPACGTILKP